MNHNPFLKQDQKIIGDIYTSSTMMDNLIHLCDDLGSRFGGTEGERLAAQFLAAELTSYGLSNVALEPIDYYGWRRGEVKLTLTSPIEKEMACITLPHSPPADLVGEIIDMGDGAPVDFDARADEIVGKIVMVSSVTNPPGSDRWIHRQEKYGRSLLAGAIGFIFVNHYPSYGPATGGIGQRNSGEAHMPGISIQKEDGDFIRRLIGRKGAVTIRIQSSDVCEQMTSWNVVAELPGKLDESEIVMLGCHYDGHDIAQGAEDPLSGGVALLEAARILAKYAPDLPHTVRFAFWGVEEIGLIGSTQYVEQHGAELDNVRFYLNLDSAGAVKQKDIILNEWPGLRPLILSWQKEMALDFGVGQSLSAHSDHFPFMVAGVPTGSIGSIKKDLGGRGYGHTMFDTVDKVRQASVREAAALAARITLRVASEAAWPVQRRSAETVKMMLDKPGFRDEADLFARVEAFYEAL